ncbi:MAG: sugar phosphate isomerase/epimerase [Clostridia bacterium]|nr:sugar phosphate isomerase/epimerase [Clostridia bacterium]
MKIGIMVMMDPIDKLESKLQAMVAEGFDNCQLQSWNPPSWTEENAAIVKGLFDKYNIEISAFWCGWEGVCIWNFYEGQETMGLVPPTYRYARMKNLLSGGKFAKMLGVTDIISHMGYIPENPFDPNFMGVVCALRGVAEQYQKDGQYLLFETGQETPTTLLRCIETIGTDNLGINLDTGNLIMYGKGSPADALVTFGKYVRNTHVKDGVPPTSSRTIGREVKLGEGRANWPVVMRDLVKDHGYDRYLTIEREIEGDQQIEDIRFARAYLEEIYNGLK